MHLGAPVAGGSSILMRKTCEGLMTTRGAETGRSKTDSTETAPTKVSGVSAHSQDRKAPEGTQNQPLGWGQPCKLELESSFVGRRRVAFHPSDKTQRGLC